MGVPGSRLVLGERREMESLEALRLERGGELRRDDDLVVEVLAPEERERGIDLRLVEDEPFQTVDLDGVDRVVPGLLWARSRQSWIARTFTIT